ncbi:MAG: ribosome silencing factor [Candidatus Marinimicrobia bacterium]|nr:ribosome silencing factor [Candidatus Neomarinimicrobiota bacterium]
MKTSPLDIYSSQSLIEEIINLAFEKKAKNLISLDLRGFSSLTDYFIICHGKSEPQVKAIVDNIRKGTSFKPRHLEGYENKKWVLLDYFDIIVHVFDENERDYYSIEQIWADAPKNEFHDEEI